MGEITRQDVAAVRDSLVGQVSAKTANHYVKALKMFFVPEDRAPSLRILRVESQRFTVVSSNRPSPKLVINTGGRSTPTVGILYRNVI
jgi:hypothetical protein